MNRNRGGKRQGIKWHKGRRDKKKVVTRDDQLKEEEGRRR